MTHICTLPVDGDVWHNFASLISEYKGTQFAFNPEKRYVLQNLSNQKIMLVESESGLGERYNEGNVVMPFEYFNYLPTGEDLYVRGAGEMTCSLITVTEEDKAGDNNNAVLSAVSEVSTQVTGLNTQVSAINDKIGDVETSLSGV